MPREGVLAMQATMRGEPGLARALLFARAGNRDYMLRSERRPDYRPPEPPRRRPRRRRRRLSVPYVCMTFLLLVLLFPVGLVMLWLRKIYWTAATKLVLTLAFSMVFVVVSSYAIMAPVQNETIAQAQIKIRSVLSDAGTRVREDWEAIDHSPERILSNAQSIAGHGLGVLQKAAAHAIPAVREHMIGFADNAREIVSGGVSGLTRQAQNWMAQIGLAPDPAATPDPRSAADPKASPLPGIVTGDPSFSPGVTPLPTASLAGAIGVPTPSALRVWFVEGGNVYHLDNGCPAMEQGAPESSSVTEAVQKGLVPCAQCAVPVALSAPSSFPVTPEPSGTPHDTSSLPGNPTRLEPSARPSLDPVSAATPSPTRAPTPSPTPIVLPPMKPVSEARVYYTSNGRYYHTGANCGSMRGAAPHTFAEAIEKGLRQCRSCGAPSADLLETENVVWNGEGDLFHITDECEALTETFALMTLEQAMLQEGGEGCPECGADLYVTAARLRAEQAAESPMPARPGV